MPKTDRVLLLLLWFYGVTTLLAVGAVVMPLSWMAHTHRWLGLGEMPIAPVVEYLARSLSTFYAFFGALCLVLATDLNRYRPLVRFLGAAIAVMSLVAVCVDVAAGMPWWWTASEGPPGIVLGTLMFFLAGHEHRTGNASGDPG